MTIFAPVMNLFCPSLATSPVDPVADSGQVALSADQHFKGGKKMLQFDGWR